MYSDDIDMVDRYETARTAVVRESRQSVQMLEDALHALRNDRTHITEEFLERTITGLRRALATNDELIGS